jgi:hypothetical protein
MYSHTRSDAQSGAKRAVPESKNIHQIFAKAKKHQQHQKAVPAAENGGTKPTNYQSILQ